jgi:hypothetical protein
MRHYIPIFWTRIFWLFIFVLAACSGSEVDEPTAVQPAITPTTSVPTSAPTPDAGDDTTGAAYIEALQVSVLESFPVQVQATVSGNLSDSCTAIAAATAQRNGQSFQIQIEATRDTEAVCTQALVPFDRTIQLDVQGLPAGTYTVTAGGLSETFMLAADNAPPPSTPNLSGASLTVGVASAIPGQTVNLSGTGFPANAVVEIGIGPPESEYEIIGTTQSEADGRFSTQIAVPTYVEPGEQWLFVAEVENAKVIADPILIASASTPTPASDAGVNEPVNGQFTRTYIFLIALEDNGQSGEMIGCNDSVIPVVVDIEPTVAPLTAALNELLSLGEQYYGQSGLYNALYQSNLNVQGVDIDNREAIIHLTGNLQLGGACDNPRVLAQLEETALQYATVDSVSITVNGQPLESLLSGQ